MSLTELIEGVEDHEKTLTIFNTAPETLATIQERFADRNIDVIAEQTARGPQEYVVLSKDGAFITAVSVDTLFDSTADEEGGRSYRPILDHLDETMFTSYDTSQMVSASREIEDRAWRIGSGTIHAGFGTLSVLESQLSTYEQLAGQLCVHLYGHPDTEIPPHEGTTIHIERAAEIRSTWFVAYDGDGGDENKCALLAEERTPNAFYGFWTYDPGTVDWIIEHLVSTYGVEVSSDHHTADCDSEWE